VISDDTKREGAAGKPAQPPHPLCIRITTQVHDYPHPNEGIVVTFRIDIMTTMITTTMTNTR